MAGYITPEGIVVPAGSDTYDYVNDWRRGAASIRSIVPVANQAAGDTIANAMNTDGRPVSDSNPLVVYDQSNGCLVVKGTAGWVGKPVSYSFLQPQTGVWTFSGSVVVTPEPDGSHLVVCDLVVTRASATGYAINGTKVSLGTVLPSQAVSSSVGIKYVMTALNNGTLAVCVGVKPADGSVIIFAPSGSGTVASGDLFTANVSYYV